jgi:hypothetical protein
MTELKLHFILETLPTIQLKIFLPSAILSIDTIKIYRIWKCEHSLTVPAFTFFSSWMQSLDTFVNSVNRKCGWGRTANTKMIKVIPTGFNYEIMLGKYNIYARLCSMAFICTFRTRYRYINLLDHKIIYRNQMLRIKLGGQIILN